MKKNIGISTVFTGYNYGSTLQAFAVQQIVKEIGYNPVLLNVKGSIFKGRDVRLGKLAIIAIRSLVNGRFIKTFGKYTESLSNEMPDGSKQLFQKFIKNEMHPVWMSKKQLKNIAESSSYKAFICGSDQIWNSSTFYIDPFYYLRYAPRNKRIAFAPSFGRNYIAKYNKKQIKKYISEIPNLSIREDSGVQLIKNLVGREPNLILDPTLILSKEKWESCLNLRGIINKKYILCYFLNQPSEKVRELIKDYSKKNGLEIIQIPYEFSDNLGSTNGKVGPKEFIELIAHSNLVLTDSFHGTVFSINFNKPFYAFERNYGNAEKQSTRISSILKKLSLENRFNPDSLENSVNINYTQCNKILEKERKFAYNYLLNSVNNTNEGI
ncbi:polysaccharide pyruvyl transferase family protein [Globicatella sanguinis]